MIDVALGEHTTRERAYRQSVTPAPTGTAPAECGESFTTARVGVVGPSWPQ